MVRRTLTQEDVLRMVTLIEVSRLSHSEVARRIGRSQSVVTRAYNRYLATGQHGRRRGQGRKRCTSDPEDRTLRHSSVQDPRRCPADLARQHHETTLRVVSRITVRRRLLEAGRTCRRPAKVPSLTANHRRDRRGFSNNYGNWRSPQWRNVLAADECRIV